MPVPIAVMASGRGSNLQVILDASQTGACPVEVQLVIVDKADAGALDIAKAANVKEVHYIDPKTFVDREAYDKACASLIEQYACEWIVLAGYMRILSSFFVQRFRNHILNIHPSLLPAFMGGTAVKDALNYGVKVAGCSVHLVDNVLDGGAILAQAMVPVLDDDTVDTLHARIQKEEHIIYPKVLARVVLEGFFLDGRKVIWNTNI